MSKAPKIKIYIYMFGNETWAITEMDMKRVGTWERKILKWMYMD
jgi:hypothetical protein